MEMHLSIILYFTYLADDTRDGDYYCSAPEVIIITTHVDRLQRWLSGARVTHRIYMSPGYQTASIYVSIITHNASYYP